MSDEMTPVEETSYAIDRSRSGESTLLSFVVPEDIGLSCAEAGWTNQARITMLVQIANGEAEGVKPGDQLNAIAYLDKIIRDALNTGGLLSEATHRRIHVEGDTKYETDVKVMRMLQPGDNNAQEKGSEDDQEDNHPRDD